MVKAEIRLSTCCSSDVSCRHLHSDCETQVSVEFKEFRKVYETMETKFGLSALFGHQYLPNSLTMLLSFMQKRSVGRVGHLQFKYMWKSSPADFISLSLFLERMKIKGGGAGE